MPIYKAVTRSGADYIIDTDRGFWEHRGTGKERIWDFKTAVDPVTMIPWQDKTSEEWKDAKEPKVGDRLYLTSRDYWRVSSRVESVEIISEADDDGALA